MRNSIAAALIAGLLLAPALLRADDAKPSDDPDKKEFPFDKGSDTIDVSKYPKEMQDIYNDTFSSKCSKCHTLARPINVPFALPEEWKAYVTKMQHKKRSGVDADSAKDIIKFLTYDSTIRKKDLLEAKQKQKKDGTYDADNADGMKTAPKDGKEEKKDEAPKKADDKPKSDK